MKKIINLQLNIIRDDIFQLGAIIGIVINLGMWLLLYRRIHFSNEPIALQYNIYFGINLIGEWYKVYAMPLIGIFVFVINYLLAFVVYKKEKIASYFLMIGAVLIQGILIFAAHLVTTYI